MNTKQRREPVVSLAKMRRQGIKMSAQGPAAVAVQRITERRHRERGLDRMETGYAHAVFAWLAAPWKEKPCD